MASRFFRPNSTVDDSVNSDRFKSFVDRIKKWGGESPGMATPMDVTGYNSIFQPGYSPPNYGGGRPQEMPIPVQAVEQGVPEVANQTSFPLSDAFYMKNGRLYASDTVSGYSKEHRRGLLDEYLKRFPDAQAGVDAWSKRTQSATKATAAGIKRTHPGTPSTSGDWTGEQKPISAQTPVAQPAPVRASGGPRGGYPMEDPEYMGANTKEVANWINEAIGYRPYNGPTVDRSGYDESGIGYGNRINASNARVVRSVDRPWYQDFSGIDNSYAVAPSDVVDRDQPMDSEYNQRQMAGGRSAYSNAAASLVPVGKMARAGYRYVRGGARGAKLATRAAEAANEVSDYTRFPGRAVNNPWFRQANTPPWVPGQGFQFPSY